MSDERNQGLESDSIIEFTILVGLTEDGWAWERRFARLSAIVSIDRDESTGGAVLRVRGDGGDEFFVLTETVPAFKARVADLKRGVARNPMGAALFGETSAPPPMALARSLAETMHRQGMHAGGDDLQRIQAQRTALDGLLALAREERAERANERPSKE